MLAGQVRRMLPDRLRSDRSARMHLQTLVEHGDLAIVRQPEPGRPNLYRLTPRGATSVAADEGGLGGWRPPLGSHLLHELLITELAVLLREAVRERTDLQVPWEERFGFHDLPAFRTLVPDYGFLFRHATGMQVCLVEVSSGEESPTRLAQKLRGYARWAESEAACSFLMGLYRQHGAIVPQPSFRLLFVAQNRRTGRDLTRLKQAVLAAMRTAPTLLPRLWGTTVTELAESDRLDAAIWLRPDDLDPVRRPRIGSARREQTAAVWSALRTASRQRLFPEATLKVKVRDVTPGTH